MNWTIPTPDLGKILEFADKDNTLNGYNKIFGGISDFEIRQNELFSSTPRLTPSQAIARDHIVRGHLGSGYSIAGLDLLNTGLEKLDNRLMNSRILQNSPQILNGLHSFLDFRHNLQELSSLNYNPELNTAVLANYEEYIRLLNNGESKWKALWKTIEWRKIVGKQVIQQLRVPSQLQILETTQKVLEGKIAKYKLDEVGFKDKLDILKRESKILNYRIDLTNGKFSTSKRIGNALREAYNSEEGSIWHNLKEGWKKSPDATAITKAETALKELSKIDINYKLPFSNTNFNTKGSIYSIPFVNGIATRLTQAFSKSLTYIPATVMWGASTLGLKDNWLVHKFLNMPIFGDQAMSAALKSGSTYSKGVETVRAFGTIGVGTALASLAFKGLGMAALGLSAPWALAATLGLSLGSFMVAGFGTDAIAKLFRTKEVKDTIETASKSGASSKDGSIYNDLDKQLTTMNGGKAIDLNEPPVQTAQAKPAEQDVMKHFSKLIPESNKKV